MTRTAPLILLVSVIFVGISLIGCGQPASIDTPAPGTTEEPAPVHLTRTAEAAAMQTVEAALAEEATSPVTAEQVKTPTEPLTATPEPTDTPAPQPTTTATATPVSTETPTPTPVPVAVQRPPGQALLLIPVVESQHPYPNDYDESWLVSNPDAEADATRLHFARLELEDRVDWLIIMDSQDVELQRLTGFHPDGIWIDPVPGNLLKLRLVTDGSVQHWGFVVDAVETVSYTSLAYSPHPYPNSAELKWSFNNLDAEAKGTRLHFSRIELEENVDWLAIMDITENPYQWITGHHPDGLWAIGVPGTGVIVKLISDGSVNDWGFNIDALESAPRDEAQARPELGKTLAESEHPYGGNVQQTWTLVNPNPGAAFTKVHFTRLDLNNDTVTLYDGDDNRLQVFGGGTHKRDFWSDDVPGRVVKVQLSTGSYDHDWGFRIDHLLDGVSQESLAESEHPYGSNVQQTWTLVNPNPGAAFTKVHFTRLDLNNDTVTLYDGGDNRLQVFGGGTHKRDFWSDDVPGRVVKVQLSTGSYDHDWGFRIDDIAPKVEETPVPAFVNAIYVHVGQPGDLSLNGVPLGRASVPGDYRIQLPGVGEHVITVESLFYRQEILAHTDEEGDVEIEYRAIEAK